MPEIVFLTGASGFIAKHIVLQLLNAGHSVRGTMRSPGRAEEVRAAVAPRLTDKTALERLSFVTLDLEQDAGWAEAAQGCTVMMHTASPFPIAQPKDPQVLVRPAVEGTLRALRAAKAAGIARVILTSSSVAVLSTPLPAGRRRYDERDWSDVSAPTSTPYVQSKTLAERAAWDFAAGEGKGIALTVINPCFVMGPPLDQHFGSSVSVVRRILRGRDPMVPRLGFACVDVRDVAALHLAALEQPATAGQRIIGSGGEMWFDEMARAVKAAYPARRIATMVAPKILLRLLALFDGEIRSILPTVGHMETVDNARAVKVLGRALTSPKEALLATADFLVSRRLA
jgi:dihydroflavonol-4-reductase